MNNRSVTTATVGYMGWALASWLLSMPNAGWFERVHGHGVATAWPLAIILGVMGHPELSPEPESGRYYFFWWRRACLVNVRLRAADGRWFCRRAQYLYGLVLPRLGGVFLLCLAGLVQGRTASRTFSPRLVADPARFGNWKLGRPWPVCVTCRISRSAHGDPCGDYFSHYRYSARARDRAAQRRRLMGTL